MSTCSICFDRKMFSEFIRMASILTFGTRTFDDLHVGEEICRQNFHQFEKTLPPYTIPISEPQLQPQVQCALPVCDLPVGSKGGDWNCLEPLQTKSGLRLQLDTALHSPVRQVLPAARLLGAVWLSWERQCSVKAMASSASKCTAFLVLS